uniref:DDHD domain-containing protein n=1 Tax=Trichobilharzia regenti TaxID=157069 RepID=A0AA85IQ22_TRIRE|nr:unnamed protein product [Trichobilharzia regenti]
MNCERQSNPKSNTHNLSGLTLSLSQASLPIGPTLVPQISSPVKSEELASFVGENENQTKGLVSGYGERFPGVNLMSSDSGHTEDTKSPPPSIPKPSGSMTVKSGQRPRYVLPPDISTVTSRTSTATNISNMPCNAFPPIPPTSEPNQVSYLLIPSNPSDGIKTAYTSLPSGTDQVTQSYSQVANPTSIISSSIPTATYHPVGAYWFYSTIVDNISIWWPFSRHDSYQIETEFFRSYCLSSTSNALPISNDDLSYTSGANETQEIIVQVDGGRYDVYVKKRERRSVYWEEQPSEVRRATWFYKPQGESRVLPFSERICDLLEAQYKLSVEQGQWGKRFELPSEDRRGGNDVFIFYSPQSMIQYLAWPYDFTSTNSESRVVASSSSPLFQLNQSQLSQEVNLTGQVFEGRLCHIHRGLTEHLMEQIDEGDYKPIDQLFFIVHGIGSMYNLKGQGLIECVNDMRRTAKQLSQSHFPHHPYRVEFLPILWHDELHSDTVTGLDKQLEQITLGSIPKLRQFTNDTLMDILFYTSSKYSQLIVNTVAREITRLRNLFLLRNPKFSGNISIIGHSLGAVISFDLLCHQNIYNPSCTATAGQLSSNSLSETYDSTVDSNVVTTHSTDTQSTTMGEVDYVDELLNDVLVKANLTTGITSSTSGTTYTTTTSTSGSSTKTTDIFITSSNSSNNSSNVNNSTAVFSMLSTCPVKDDNTFTLNTPINEENKSEHSSTSGQNDMDGWSIVDYNQNNNSSKGHTKRKINSDIDSAKCQLDSMLNLSSNNADNNLSHLSQLLLQNGLNVDQIHNIIHSLIKLDKTNKNKTITTTDENSSTITSSNDLACQLSTTNITDVGAISPHSTLTSFWLENHRFCLSQANNNSNANYVTAGFGIALPNYPQLGFNISGLYTLGSPIPLFLTARGIRTLSREFRLPTCSTFYNIFHPFDPVAYRMEMLIDSEFQQKAILIPHHKGRKRIHLQLKDNLAWVGSELKSKLYSSVQSTWRSLHEFALAHRFIGASSESSTGDCYPPRSESSIAYGDSLRSGVGDEVDGESEDSGACEDGSTTYRNLIDEDVTFNSQLNQGRRMDYVLQEAPLESFNEYLFALTSHAAYWDSIDTVLFILTEAYSEQGIVPIMPGQKDIPQNTIRVGALSPPPPPPPPASTRSSPPVHSTAASAVCRNISPDEIPSPSQFDHIAPPNTFNQNNAAMLTSAAETISTDNLSCIAKNPAQISASYFLPSSVTTTTAAAADTTTVAVSGVPSSSYFQPPVGHQHLSTDSLSSIDNSTQRYSASQAYSCNPPGESVFLCIYIYSFQVMGVLDVLLFYSQRGGTQTDGPRRPASSNSTVIFHNQKSAANCWVNQ